MRTPPVLFPTLLFAALLFAQTASPQTVPPEPAAAPEARSIAIREVPVWGRRPMKATGMHVTQFDSAALRQHIALSVADVLGFGSSLFVKNYGRATLSTVSFRGTGPSHTQVTWNGMRMSNPMLGMTDFSMIPSYFVDGVSLLHGTSSLTEAGGGLGGLVKLSTAPAAVRGFGLQYVQGAGMYRTFDEFVRLVWGNDRWQVSTRAVCQSSANDFKYRNRDRKENIYDDQMQIIGQYYPVERNRNGAFRDVHVLQEVTYDAGRGDRIGLSAWYVNSDRELALLTSDYASERNYENRQREHTLRAVVSWDRLRRAWKFTARAGYIHTWLAYDYRRDPGNGTMQLMTRSRSRIDTFYGQADAECAVGEKWLFTASLAAHQHLVRSVDKAVIKLDGQRAVVGYDKGRVELSGAVTARWRPVERLGLSLLLREELFGTAWTPVIPAFFADWLLSKKGNLVARASVSRNYRFPTLNDLYFLPGGNPDLRSESGYSYEAGVSFAVGGKRCTLSGSASWYEQHIDDWIIWLPTPKGFMSPANIKKVHAYGVETEMNFAAALSKAWALSLSGTFSWAPSVNEGEPLSEADRSVGRQLPYEPEYSATLTGRLAFRRWSLVYQWCHYSRRYTMSSNAVSLTGSLTPYFMSNLSLEKQFVLRWADLSLKAAVNNLFDEEYLSVLSRPMPRMNAEFFIGITPKWGRKGKQRGAPTLGKN